MDTVSNQPELGAPAPSSAPVDVPTWASANTPNNVVDNKPEISTRTIRRTEAFSMSANVTGTLVHSLQLTKQALSTMDKVVAAQFTSHEKWRIHSVEATLTNAEKLSTAAGVCKTAINQDVANVPPTDAEKLSVWISSIPDNKNISARANGDQIGFTHDKLSSEWKYTNTSPIRDPNLYSYPPMTTILQTPGSSPQVQFQLDIKIHIEFKDPLKVDGTHVQDNVQANLRINAFQLQMGTSPSNSSMTYFFDPATSNAPDKVGNFQPYVVVSKAYALTTDADGDPGELYNAHFQAGFYNKTDNSVTGPLTDFDIVDEAYLGEKISIDEFDLPGVITFSTTISNELILKTPMGLEQDYGTAKGLIQSQGYSTSKTKQALKYFRQKLPDRTF